jgi:hypothetical protein
MVPLELLDEGAAAPLDAELFELEELDELEPQAPMAIAAMTTARTAPSGLTYLFTDPPPRGRVPRANNLVPIASPMTGRPHA